LGEVGFDVKKGSRKGGYLGVQKKEKNIMQKGGYRGEKRKRGL